MTEYFDRLFEDHYPSLLFVAAHVTGDEAAARDIVQDVFARLWASRHKYTHLKSPSDFLFVAVRNRAITWLRSKRTELIHRDRLAYEERFRAALVAEEAYAQLAEAIDRLPARCGEVIRLSIEGVSQKEIAERMGIALATVKSLKAAAMKKLRAMLGIQALAALYAMLVG